MPPAELHALANLDRLLYGVLWKIQAALYGHNLGCDEMQSETSIITSIFQLEQEINEWHRLLPSCLCPHSHAGLAKVGPSTVERFRFILTLRYFNVQLLLYRPVFILSLETRDPNAATVKHMQLSFNRTFVQAAENTIDLIHTVLTKPHLGRHFIGAWWFTLYYSMI